MVKIKSILYRYGTGADNKDGYKYIFTRGGYYYKYKSINLYYYKILLLPIL